MADDARLTQVPILKGVLKFSIPLALAMAFHGLFNCVDLLIVGRLGPGAVAAVTLGGIINMVAMLAFNGVANVVAGRCAVVAGTGETKSLAALVASGRNLTKWLSLVFGFGFAIVSRPMILSFGVDSQTETEATLYLLILSVGSGTMFYLLFQSACLRSLGDSRNPMIALIGANVLNLGLDVLLVFGLWGFPQLGVAGAAWATVISRFLGAIYLGRILKRREKAWPQVIPRNSQVLNILKEGLIHSAQMVVRVVSILGLLMIASFTTDSEGGGKTTDMLDGIGVAIRLEMVVLFCALGWGTAAASFLGQNIGANKFARSASGMKVAVIGALLSCLFLAGILYCLPIEMLSFVAPEAYPAAIEQGATYLRIVLWGHPGLIIGIVLSQALVGLGSVKTAVLVDFVLYVLVGLPLAFFLTQGADRPDSAWMSIQWIHLISAPIYLILFRKHFLVEKQIAAATSAIAS